jgi:hypothetical protein
VISPSNIQHKAKDQISRNGEEDIYGINKDLLQKIVQNKRPNSVRRNEKSKLKQKIEDNKKLIDIFFTKKTPQRVKDERRNEEHGDHLYLKNSFEDFYSKISSSVSVKDLKAKY